MNLLLEEYGEALLGLFAGAAAIGMFAALYLYITAV